MTAGKKTSGINARVGMLVQNVLSHEMGNITVQLYIDFMFRGAEK